MKKMLYLFFSLFVIGVLLFTSCEALGLTGDEVDITITYVEPLMDGSDVAGVRIILKNLSTNDQTVDYSVYFSSDTTISSVTDTLVYSGSETIGSGLEKQIDLGTVADIKPYISTHSLTIAEGDYYIGVLVDPADLIAEINESNNEIVSTDTFPFAAVYQDGSLTFEITNAGDYNGATVYYMVQTAGGTYPDDYLGGGMFDIISGGGSYLTQADAGGNLTLTGGEAYELGYFIDVNGDYDPDSLEGPGQGDLGGESFEIALFNGDMTLTLDLDTDPVYFNGSIVCELDFADAAGGEVVFFVAETGPYNTEDDPSTWITASIIVTVDSNGYALGVLEAGYPPVEDGTVFYPTESTDYDYYIAVDMGGIINTPYNDPYDYVDVMFEDGGTLRTQTFNGGTEHLEFTGFDLKLIEGIVVDASAFSSIAYDNLDIRYDLYNTGDGSLEDSGVVTWEERDSDDMLGVVGTGYPWDGDPGEYELEYYVDKDDSGDFTSGDWLGSQIIDYTSPNIPQTVVLYSSNLHLFVDGITSVYSDTEGSILTFNPIAGSDENCTYNAESDGVTAYDGSNSLEVNFCDPDDTTWSWLHMDFDRRIQLADDSVVRSLDFYMNSDDASAATLAELNYIITDSDEYPDNMNSVGNVLDHYVSGPDANGWSLYSIPFLGDSPGDADMDIKNLEGIKFGTTKDAGGAYLQCRLYFDYIVIVKP